MSAPMTHIHIFSPHANQRDRFFKPHILTRLKNIIFRWQTDPSWWFWADYYYGKEGLRPETNWELGKGWTARSTSTHPPPHKMEEEDFEFCFAWPPCLCITMTWVWASVSLTKFVPTTSSHLGCKHAFRKSASGPIFFSEFAFYVFYSCFGAEHQVPHFDFICCLLSVKMQCHVGQTNRPWLVHFVILK